MGPDRFRFEGTVRSIVRAAAGSVRPSSVLGAIVCAVLIAVPAPPSEAARRDVDLDGDGAKESRVKLKVLSNYPGKIQNKIINRTDGLDFTFTWKSAGPGFFDSRTGPGNRDGAGAVWNWETTQRVFSFTGAGACPGSDDICFSGETTAAIGPFDVPGRSLEPSGVTLTNESLTFSLITFFSPPTELYRVVSSVSQLTNGAFKFETVVTNFTDNPVEIVIPPGPMGCEPSEGSCDNDGTRDEGEECDGEDVGDATCAEVCTVCSEFGTLEGCDPDACVSVPPGCTLDCTYDADSCVPSAPSRAFSSAAGGRMFSFAAARSAGPPALPAFETWLAQPPQPDGEAFCGDSTINQEFEECDGADLGGMDCTDFGFSGGTLLCDPEECFFDTSECLDVPCEFDEVMAAAVEGDSTVVTCRVSFNPAKEVSTQVLVCTDPQTGISRIPEGTMTCAGGEKGTLGTVNILVPDTDRVIGPDDVFLSPFSVEVTEDSGNGFVEPGESAALVVSLINGGPRGLSDVSATLTAPDVDLDRDGRSDPIVIMSGASTYPDIPGAAFDTDVQSCATAKPLDPVPLANTRSFRIEVPPDHPEDTVHPLDLEISASLDGIDGGFSATIPFVLGVGSACDPEDGDELDGLEGFLPPVRSRLVPAGDGHAEATESFRRGRTLPLKMRLLCAGRLLDDGDVAPPEITSLSRDGTPLGLAGRDLDAGRSNGDGLAFRHIGGGVWLYNLKTKGLERGRYEIGIGTPNGASYIAAFLLR